MYRSVSVTDEADTQDLATLEAVKRELSIATSEHDEDLLNLIHEESKDISDELNRVFALETVVETVVLDDPQEVINLSRYPNVTITSVVEDGETLSSDYYRVLDSSGQIWRRDGSGNSCRWTSNVDIVFTYSGGYELLDALPRPLESFCRSRVKAKWFGARRDPFVRQEEVPGVYSATYWVGNAPGGADADPYAPVRRYANIVV